MKSFKTYLYRKSSTQIKNHFTRSRIVLGLNFCFAVMLFYSPAFGQVDSCEFEIDKSSGRKVYLFSERMPQYVGGNDSLMRYITRNLTLPEDDGANYSGRVVISFIVEPDGTLSNKRILKGIYPKADSAILNMIDKMPNWVPGECNGKKIPFKILFQYS